MLGDGLVDVQEYCSAMINLAYTLVHVKHKVGLYVSVHGM
jgi:hypothetical protein